MPANARRGWRQTVEPGIRRVHTLRCPATERSRASRCECPYEIQVPAAPPRRSRKLTFRGTLAEARTERSRLIGEGRPEPAADPLATPQTLDDLAARYLAVRSTTLAPNTITTTERHYVKRVGPTLGNLPLAVIDRARVEGWLAGLIERGASRRQVVGSVAALRGILSAAVEWDLLERNPAMGLRLPAPETQEAPTVERVLSPAQVLRLVEVGCAPSRAGAKDSPRAETMIRVALEAGLRRGEVIGLKWPDLDLGARTLTVRRSISQTPDGKGGSTKVERTTKGKKARRIGLSDALAERLADWFALAVVERGAAAGGYVWPGRGGVAMDKDTPGQLLGRVLDRAGLLEPDGSAPVTFHGLRHTCASLLFAAGVPLLVISRQLGHATPQVTSVVYAHLVADDQLAKAGATVWNVTLGRGERTGEISEST